MEEIPITQKTYDLIKWYVPILNRLPKNHRFLLGDRMVAGLYDFLEQLIKARFEKNKLARLEDLNSQLAILRYQTRLLLDFQQMEVRRFEYVSKLINEIGTELGGWIKQQQEKQQAQQQDKPNETLRKPVVANR
jgi:hypothetical protein